MPAVVTQLVPDVNVTAPAQSSFDGGGTGFVTHISKSPLIVGLLPIFDTLIKYVAPILNADQVKVVALQVIEANDPQEPL